MLLRYVGVTTLHGFINNATLLKGQSCVFARSTLRDTCRASNEATVETRSDGLTLVYTNDPWRMYRRTCTHLAGLVRGFRALGSFIQFSGGMLLKLLEQLMRYRVARLSVFFLSVDASIVELRYLRLFRDIFARRFTVEIRFARGCVERR